MTTMDNLSGKKAAPFRKGGKRRAKIASAKSVLAGARKVGSAVKKASYNFANEDLTVVDLSWDQWNAQHKGASHQQRAAFKDRLAKVHAHLSKSIKVKTINGKRVYATADGNGWGSHEDALKRTAQLHNQNRAKKKNIAKAVMKQHKGKGRKGHSLSNEEQAQTDLAFRFRHGWIKIGGSDVPDEHTSKILDAAKKRKQSWNAGHDQGFADAKAGKRASDVDSSHFGMGYQRGYTEFSSGAKGGTADQHATSVKTKRALAKDERRAHIAALKERNPGQRVPPMPGGNTALNRLRAAQPVIKVYGH